MDGSCDAAAVQEVGKVSHGRGLVYGQGLGLCEGREQGSEVGLAGTVVQFLSSDQLENMDTVNTEMEKTIQLDI